MKICQLQKALSRVDFAVLPYTILSATRYANIPEVKTNEIPNPPVKI